MASIERTAYPHFHREPSARDLQDLFTVSEEEAAFGRSLARSDQHFLAVMTLLKCLQHLGYFPTLASVPLYGATNAIADPGRVLQLWGREFIGIRGENGCFVLTCHPYISGRASRILLLEDLVRIMRRSRRLWFATCEAVARWLASEGNGPKSSRRRIGRTARGR